MKLYAAWVFLAEEGESATEAHHWWLPETKEIIWGGLAFLIIFLALWKFALPAMKKGLADRSERIARQLDDSAARRVAAEAEQKRVKAALRDIDAETARIHQEAARQAVTLQEEGFARNDREAADAEARALADLAQQRGRLNSELQAQIAAMAAESAERYVQSSLDAATHEALIEQFITKVGSAR